MYFCKNIWYLISFEDKKSKNVDIQKVIFFGILNLIKKIILKERFRLKVTIMKKVRILVLVLNIKKITHFLNPFHQKLLVSDGNFF